MSKRKLKIALLALPLSLTLLVAVAALVVHTRSFNRFLVRQFISRIEQGTGVRIEVRSLKLTWSPFTAELFGIVAHGKEESNEPPLFQADRLGISLSLRALLRHEIDLYSIELDRPALNARIDTA